MSQSQIILCDKFTGECCHWSPGGIHEWTAYDLGSETPQQACREICECVSTKAETTHYTSMLLDTNLFATIDGIPLWSCACLGITVSEKWGE